MKALCRLGYNKYTVTEIPTPEISSEEDILVRIKCCTDNVIFERPLAAGNDPYSAYSKIQPQQVGTVASGIVERVGKAYSMDFKPGDRVTGFYRVHCGKCEACKNGMERMCSNMDFSVGTLAEHIIWHGKQVYKLPETVDFDIACFTIPVMRMLRVLDSAGIRMGDAVAVNGSGYFSLIMVQLLKMAGAGDVTVFSVNENIRRRALTMGADHVFDPLTVRLSNVLAVLPKPGAGFRTLVDFDCDASRLRRLTGLLGDAGNLIIPVYNTEEDLSLPLSVMYINELNIKVIKDDIHYMSRALRLLPRLRLKELISRPLTLEESSLLYSSGFYEDNTMGLVYL